MKTRTRLALLPRLVEPLVESGSELAGLLSRPYAAAALPSFRRARLRGRRSGLSLYRTWSGPSATRARAA